VLLNTTSSNNQTEKVATPNLTLRGFDFIDKVKSLLEAACPAVVSCADIVALVARDAVVATVRTKISHNQEFNAYVYISSHYLAKTLLFELQQGGPFWRVPTGRRDGTISRSSEALNNIPPPTSNFTNLQRLFANQGLDLKDLVLLSGTTLKENATP
jgi:peroxidase